MNIVVKPTAYKYVLQIWITATSRATVAAQLKYTATNTDNTYIYYSQPDPRHIQTLPPPSRSCHLAPTENRIYLLMGQKFKKFYARPIGNRNKMKWVITGHIQPSWGFATCPVDRKCYGHALNDGLTFVSVAHLMVIQQNIDSHSRDILTIGSTTHW